jgi:hypothetical protein
MPQCVAPLFRFLLFFVFIAQVHAQEPRIMEFLASNTNGIRG